MPRVKRGKIASKRRKNLLKKAKGYMWRRKSHFRAAKEALIKAGKYAYRDRRNKKRTARRLHIVKLNAAARLRGIAYSALIERMKSKNIELDRKVLSQLAVCAPKTFKILLQEINK